MQSWPWNLGELCDTVANMLSISFINCMLGYSIKILELENMFKIWLYKGHEYCAIISLSVHILNTPANVKLFGYAKTAFFCKKNSTCL
jgi:hypothetical protein